MLFPAENPRGVAATGFWRRVRRHLASVASAWFCERLGAEGGKEGAAAALAAATIQVRWGLMVKAAAARTLLGPPRHGHGH